MKNSGCFSLRSGFCLRLMSVVFSLCFILAGCSSGGSGGGNSSKEPTDDVVPSANVIDSTVSDIYDFYNVGDTFDVSEDSVVDVDESDVNNCPIGHDFVADTCVEGDATFYLAVNGDDLDAGSKTSPWKTFSFAFSQMGSGDTLIVMDGEYNEAITGIPNGLAGNYTVVMAESNFGVEIDGDFLVDSPLEIKNTQHHIYVQGFHFKGANTTGNVHVARVGLSIDYTNELPDDGAHHVVLSQNIFQGGDVAETNFRSSVVVVEVSKNILLKDNVAFGKANRSQFEVFRSSNVVLRRNLARWDSVNGDNQELGQTASSFVLSDTSHSILENNLALDGLHTSAPGTTTASFYMTAHYIGCNENRVLGNVALNNASRSGMAIDPGNNNNTDGFVWTCNNNLIESNVLWNNAGGLGYGVDVGQVSAASNRVNNVLVNKNTIGGHTQGRGVSVDGGVKNVLFIHNILFDNGTVANRDYSKLSVGGSLFYLFGKMEGGVGEINMINNTVELDPILRDLTQIDSSSPAKGAASDGGDIGANVIKRYQNSVLTDDDLWPWLNEAVIQQKLCADVAETRGLCAFDSITDYVRQQVSY